MVDLDHRIIMFHCFIKSIYFVVIFFFFFDVFFDVFLPIKFINRSSNNLSICIFVMPDLLILLWKKIKLQVKF